MMRTKNNNPVSCFPDLIQIIGAGVKKNLVITLLLFIPLMSSGQEKIKKFVMLRMPEKCWVMAHPFVAGRAFRISEYVQHYCDTMQADSIIDNDHNGGTRDAFKHAFWMASLCREIPVKKAIKLGNAHEKSNRIDFRKKHTEDGALPDSANSLMDSLNNRQGIALYLQNKNLSSNEMIGLIQKAIVNGELWVIYKDSSGRFLQCNGLPLPIEATKKQWNSSRCIVRSSLHGR